MPIEIVGRTDLDEGSVVAYALNGTVGAVGEVEVGRGPDDRLINGIVPPRLFVEGSNDLVAYLVEGDPGDETLRLLALDSG